MCSWLKEANKFQRYLKWAKIHTLAMKCQVCTLAIRCPTDSTWSMLHFRLEAPHLWDQILFELEWMVVLSSSAFLFHLWSKVVASAPGLMTIFPPAGRREGNKMDISLTPSGPLSCSIGHRLSLSIHSSFAEQNQAFVFVIPWFKPAPPPPAYRPHQGEQGLYLLCSITGSLVSSGCSVNFQRINEWMSSPCFVSEGRFLKEVVSISLPPAAQPIAPSYRQQLWETVNRTGGWLLVWRLQLPGPPPGSCVDMRNFEFMAGVGGVLGAFAESSARRSAQSHQGASLWGRYHHEQGSLGETWPITGSAGGRKVRSGSQKSQTAGVLSNMAGSAWPSCLLEQRGAV